MTTHRHNHTVDSEGSVHKLLRLDSKASRLLENAYISVQI